MPSQSSSLQNQEILHLIQGYLDFREQYFSQGKSASLYRKLVQEGQSPKTMIIACSDARVDPSIILGTQPGELFVVRNVANLVPPYDNDPKHHGTSAALEFAVRTLNVEHIIVMGHSYCGGIRALLSTGVSQESSFITSWMNIANAAKETVLARYLKQPLEEQAHVCEQESLLISLANLHTFPWIEEKIQKNQLSLHAWHFDLGSGIIQRYNEIQKQFEDLQP